MNKNLKKIFILIFLLLLILLIFIKDLSLKYENMKYYLQVITFNKNLINNNLLDKPLDKINKIGIVTYENRKGEYIDLHNKNITEYCNKWNYEYIFYDKCIHNTYWCKIYIVLELLKSGKYDYVLWMDSDTIIKNSDISLDSIVNRYSSDIFIGKNNDLSFCAGVFIIKNSPIGISYLENCIKKFKNNNCVKDDGSLKGKWAGICYEQGTMNKLIYDKYWKYTTVLPKNIIYNDYIYNDMSKCNTNTFILHAYGSPNNLRADCFRKYL